MKKIFIILFLYQSAHAQYRKLPLDTSHTWSEHYLNYRDGIQECDKLSCTYQYKIQDDLPLLNKVYKHVVRSGAACIACKQEVPAVPAAEGAFIREDTVLKRVIILDPNYSEKILYNFNKQVGDTAMLYDNDKSMVRIFKVTARDSVLLADGYHRRLTYAGGEMVFPEIQGVVVEGIGSAGGLLYPYYSGRGGHWLVCLQNSYSGAVYRLQSVYGSECPVAHATRKHRVSGEGVFISLQPQGEAILIRTPANTHPVIELRTAIGQTLQVLKSTGKGLHTVNTAGLENGLYFVSIKDGSSAVNGYFVKSEYAR